MSESKPATNGRIGIFDVDASWLEGLREQAIDPALPIVDPHHHLWDRGSRYLLDEFRADLHSGHNVVASVFVQCDAMHRATGDPDFAPVGETEFVNGVAAMSASGGYGPTRVCAGIVGYADLQLGASVDAVLEAHLRAGGGRFRGVRGRSVWDADSSIKGSSRDFPPGLLLDRRFREGFARLKAYGLTFDAWLFHPQIPELADLAQKNPDIPIVLDHVGAPLGIGAYAGKRDEVFAAWKQNLRSLAPLPNVHVKLGGLAMHLFGFEIAPEHRSAPASSEELAALWGPYIETCIETFGVDRCMFESNFPVDKRAVSYTTLWNVFKRIAASYSDAEKAALFHDTAARFYRLAA